MNIVLTGASGFIGGRLGGALLRMGGSVRALGRKPPRYAAQFWPWDPVSETAPTEPLEGADAVIHLAGEPVAQRWNAAVKRRIYDSRVLGTRHLVAALAKLEKRPKILIAASAIGYYGDTGEQAATEDAAPGKGFLAETCVEWERESMAAEQFGLRVVRLRIGIVLGREGGALPEMLGPFKMGAGGPLGSGQQWMSWIHVDDLIAAIGFLLATPVAGAVNATSPEPVRNAGFARELGAVLHRPAAVPVPRFALKLMMGELAGFMLESQRIVPAVLTRSGFEFRWPALRPALENLLA